MIETRITLRPSPRELAALLLLAFCWGVLGGMSLTHALPWWATVGVASPTTLRRSCAAAQPLCCGSWCALDPLPPLAP